MKRRHVLQAMGAWSSASWCGAGDLPSSSRHATPRLVSIHGSLTEIVYLLDAQHTLVGTDTTSTHPLAAGRTPKVGYLRQLSAEGLMSLQPDVVLGTDEAGPPKVLAQLRQAGVPLRLVPVRHRFDDLLDKVSMVGEATQRPGQARALAASLQRDWQALLQRVAKASASPPRVLFIMAHGPAPMVAGQGTGAHAVLSMLGTRAALPDVRGWQPLSAESAVQARPDWVITTQESLSTLGGPHSLWRLPGLALTPAGRQQQLLAFDAMALLGFGPRLPATLDALYRALT